MAGAHRSATLNSSHSPVKAAMGEEMGVGGGEGKDIDTARKSEWYPECPLGHAPPSTHAFPGDGRQPTRISLQASGKQDATVSSKSAF